MDDLNFKNFQPRFNKRPSCQFEERKLFNPAFISAMRKHLLDSTKPALPSDIYSFQVESVSTILSVARTTPLHITKVDLGQSSIPRRVSSYQNKINDGEQTASPDSFTRGCTKGRLLKKVISQRKLISNVKKPQHLKIEPQPISEQPQITQKQSLLSLSFGELQQDVEMKVSIKYLRKLGKQRREIVMQEKQDEILLKKPKRITLKNLQVKAESVKINEQEQKYIEFAKEYRQYEENMFKAFQENNRKRLISNISQQDDLPLLTQAQSGERIASTSNNSPQTKESQSQNDKQSLKFQDSDVSLNCLQEVRGSMSKSKLELNSSDIDQSKQQEQMQQLGESFTTVRRKSTIGQGKPSFIKLKLTPLNLVSNKNSPRKSLRIKRTNIPQTTKGAKQISLVLNDDVQKQNLKQVKKNLQKLAFDLDNQKSQNEESKHSLKEQTKIKIPVSNKLLLRQIDHVSIKTTTPCGSTKSKNSRQFKNDFADCKLISKQLFKLAADTALTCKNPGYKCKTKCQNH